MMMALHATLLLACALQSSAADVKSELEVKAEVERLRAEYHWPTGTEALGPEGTIPGQDCASTPAAPTTTRFPGIVLRDCLRLQAVQQLAYEYSLQLQPWLGPLLEVWDALELTTICNLTRPPARPGNRQPPSYPQPTGAVYVDPAGSASAAGSAAAPLRTVGAALKLCAGKATKAVILRAGVHFLAETLEVDAALSELVVQNYPGEEAWISGGIPLTASWTPSTANHAAAATATVYSTKTPLSSIPGLNRLDATDPLHARMTRARYPNKVPDTTMEHGLAPTAGTTWLKPDGWGKVRFSIDFRLICIDFRLIFLLGSPATTSRGPRPSYPLSRWSPVARRRRGGQFSTEES